MIKQKWTVKIDERAVEVGYSYSRISGKTVLCVDGDSFSVKGKPFGIGCARREMIMVGGEQAILNVAKNGKAHLICREGEVTELETC